MHCGEMRRKKNKENYRYKKIMKKLITIAVAFAIAVSCEACSNAKAKNSNTGEGTKSEQPQPKSLPEGAVSFDYARHLYFDVVLRDSIPARMVFDTGNTNLLLDSEFYKQHFAHLGKLRRAMVAGAGNTIQATNLDMSGWKYRIGEHSQNEQQAVVIDLRKILGSQVDGMFGMEFMRGRRVEFNYAQEWMRVLSAEEQLAEGYTCVKCKWLDNRESRMIVPMKITLQDGRVFEGNFLIDMGASEALALNSGSASKLNLSSTLTDVKKKIYDTGGVGGSRTDYLFKAQSVKIADYDIANVNASYSGNTQGAMADNRYDGIIGNALLECFDVVFDFAKCEIWLRPNGNITAASAYDLGITLTPQQNCWVVNGMIEGGNAAKAGLKRGDTIIAINDLPTNELDIKELSKLYKSAEKWNFVVKRDNTTLEIAFDKER